MEKPKIEIYSEDGRSVDTGLNDKIIEREIFRSGRTIDGRYTSPRDVKEIFTNTKTLLADVGFLPLKFGHYDGDQLLKGKILDISLKKKRRKKTITYDFIIIAKMQYSTEAQKQITLGLLPNVSVEMAEHGITQEGKDIGFHIYALALLGIDPPAIPWLANSYNTFSKVQTFYYSLMPKGGKLMNNEQTSQDFDSHKEQLQEAVSIIQTVIETLADEGEGEEEAPPVEEAAASPNEVAFDSDVRIAELEKQLLDATTKLSEFEIKSGFNKLHSEGKIATSDKAQFSKLVNKNGLVFAMDFYKTNKAKSPPLTVQRQTQVKSTPEADEHIELSKKWEAHYAKNGLDGEALKKYTKMASQKELFKMEGLNGTHR